MKWTYTKVKSGESRKRERERECVREREIKESKNRSQLMNLGTKNDLETSFIRPYHSESFFDD